MSGGGGVPTGTETGSLAGEGREGDGASHTLPPNSKAVIQFWNKLLLT